MQLTKLQPWDRDTAKRVLSERLKEAIEYRTRFEYFWEENEALMFDATGSLDSAGPAGNTPPEFTSRAINAGLDSSGVTQNSAIAFKNTIYTHSQLSANPPSVIAEPATSDPDDRLAALGADRLVTSGRTVYGMANKIDLWTYSTLIYGTSYLQMRWDSSRGEIIDVTEASEVILEGDLCIKIPSVWDIYLDPHARLTEDVRFLFERETMPLDTAIARWPKMRDKLEDLSVGSDEREDRPGKRLTVFHYWEKGLAENGYDGRYIICLQDGEVLGELRSNPHRFLSAETVRKVKKKYSNYTEEEVNSIINRIPQKAELPYHILTYIDVPNTPYGKSTLDYVGPIQHNINRLMLTALDNAAAHGAIQMVIPEASEIDEDALANSPFKVIKVSGQSGAWNLQMPQLLGDMGPLIDREIQHINDVMGVNDAMFGQMKRETANSALQSAAAQGSMIRRRLFNKYTSGVEQIYVQYLKLIRKHFDIERIYHLIGKEHPLEAAEIKTMDLDGGYTLNVTYGASFSLDPITRRQEIAQYIPAFKEAGVPSSVILDMFQLTELRGLYDRNRVAKERQLEVFDKMLETGIYEPPKENQDHAGMLAAALDYVMTREFVDLEEEDQFLINQHISELKQMAANVQAAGMPNLEENLPPGLTPELPAL